MWLYRHRGDRIVKIQYKTLSGDIRSRHHMRNACILYYFNLVQILELNEAIFCWIKITKMHCVT